MKLLVRNFRTTFIWAESLHRIPGDTAGSAEKFQFLTQGDLYQERFPDFLECNDLLDLHPPWGTHSTQRFWKFYLPGSVLAVVSPKQAWRYLVPLCQTLPFAVDAGNSSSASLEGYYYPHGTALVLTLDYATPRTLQETVDIAWKTRRHGKVWRHTPGGTESLPLHLIVEEGLRLLRESLLGPKARPGPMRDPFSVCTVIKAAFDTVPKTVAQNADLRRALRVLTSWPPNPAQPADDSGCLPDTAGGEDVIYAHERGRTLWFPRLFTEKAQPSVHSLGCFHRNLVFGSMQVDSLGGLVTAVAANLNDGTKLSELSSTLRTCAENACDRLADLFTGDKRRTYRSMSLQWQIRQNYLADLNFVRKIFRPAAAELK